MFISVRLWQILIVFSAVFVYLTSTMSSYASTSSFLYDGDGNRVAKIVNNEVTIYSGGIEKNLNTGKVSKYYSIKGNSVAQKKDGVITYLIRNHTNSSSLTTDVTGAVTSKQTLSLRIQPTKDRNFAFKAVCRTVK